MLFVFGYSMGGLIVVCFIIVCIWLVCGVLLLLFVLCVKLLFGMGIVWGIFFVIVLWLLVFNFVDLVKFLYDFSIVVVYWVDLLV